MKYLDLAAKIAMGGDNNKSYLLAAIVKRKDGAVVVSLNSLTITPQPAAHAEAKVLRKADAGCELYVARVLRASGDWACAAPCPRCQALIRARGVKRVYYTIAPNEYGVWDVSRDKTPKR